jgi:hypothetical protein
MASLFSVVSVFMLISTFLESGVASAMFSAGLTFFAGIAVLATKPITMMAPNAKWFQYLFFEHWQIAGHANGSFPFDNWSIIGSLGVLGAWSSVCIILGISYFQSKDIKG